MTKTATPNYTAAGTQFPVADNATDALTKEDLFTLQKAVSEHTHDDTRGLAIRRINTASAPSGTGQVRINGDLFQWWAGTAGVVRAAASVGEANVWTGANRFNEPIVIPDNGGTPAAPGAGLNVLYGKNGQIYQRSGAAGQERPVGFPPGIAIVAKAFNTLGTAGTWAELRSITLSGGDHLDECLTFDGTATERADFSIPVPPGYAGTPISFYIHWRTSATAGNAAFRVDATVTSAGGDLTAARGTVAAMTAFAAQGTTNRKATSTLSWTAGLPVANDFIQGSFFRVAADASDTINGVDLDVLAVTVSFG
jgi:hypothetical protein